MAQPELSQRELQVLKQMALEERNKEIGQVLYISEHTVNHVQAILEAQRRRPHLAPPMAQRGLVDIG
jgi:DNA-binding CsgD family transcriptional regulator